MREVPLSSGLRRCESRKPPRGSEVPLYRGIQVHLYWDTQVHLYMYWKRGASSTRPCGRGGAPRRSGRSAFGKELGVPTLRLCGPLSFGARGEDGELADFVVQRGASRGRARSVGAARGAPCSY